MKNEQDLRVIKTRRNIMESFLALLKEKPLEEISVTEICDRAQCSRNTFYLHFPYKDALYEKVVDGFVDTICGSFQNFEVLPGESEEAYAQRHMHIVGEALLSRRGQLTPILTGEHAHVFFAKLTDKLRDTLLGLTEQMFPGASQKGGYRLVCWYSASAITGFLRGCIYDVPLDTPEALDILCMIHVPVFVASYKYLEE